MPAEAATSLAVAALQDALEVQLAETRRPNRERQRLYRERKKQRAVDEAERLLAQKAETRRWNRERQERYRKRKRLEATLFVPTACATAAASKQLTTPKQLATPRQSAILALQCADLPCRAIAAEDHQALLEAHAGATSSPAPPSTHDETVTDHSVAQLAEGGGSPRLVWTGCAWVYHV